LEEDGLWALASTTACPVLDSGSFGKLKDTASGECRENHYTVKIRFLDRLLDTYSDGIKRVVPSRRPFQNPASSYPTRAKD
jgi:hypothetical protein